MNKLKLHTIANIDELARPQESHELSPDTPAVAFFTDFEKVPPLVLDASTTAIDAKQMMRKTHVHMHFVLNEREQFIGVITDDDLKDRTIVRKISEGYGRQEVLVSDLMRCKKNLLALDIDEVMKVSIGDVIKSMKEYGQHHCLVVDPETHRIRGIFSVRDISRKLNMAIDIPDRSSFYKVFSSVA